MGLITRTRRIISCPDRQEIRDAGDFNERYLYLGLQEPVIPDQSEPFEHRTYFCYQNFFRLNQRCIRRELLIFGTHGLFTY